MGLCSCLRFILYLLLSSSLKVTAKEHNDHRRRLTMKIEGYGYICTHEELIKISSQHPIANSACPPRDWLTLFADSIPKESKKANVFVIGCNKGDEWVTLMNLFSGNSTYNVNAYHSNVLDYIKNKTSCNDEQAKQVYACDISHRKLKLKVNQDVKAVKAYCIEPIGSNIQLLRALSTTMQFDPSAAVVMKMALNSYNGIAMFPKDQSIGYEIAGLNDNLGDKQPDNVTMRNMDTLVNENLLPTDTIDFVSLDTEGFDAEVIMGFFKTLVTRHVRCIEFEYHKDRRWSTADLQMIITMFDLLTFDCFVQGNDNEIWRLTGCWHRDYGKRRWSNIVCINRKEPFHSWFERESKKFMT